MWNWVHRSSCVKFRSSRTLCQGKVNLVVVVVLRKKKLIKKKNQITAILAAGIGILFWGRNLEPVTQQLGSASMIFMSFAFYMTFLLMYRADSFFTYFEPCLLLLILGGFCTRLVILYRKENKWLFQTKKNDSSSSTYLPAISSDTYSNGTDV
jgi:hypothetical protein